MKILVGHKGMDWILVVTDHDYEPAVEQTRDQQGFPESAHITDGYAQLDASGALVSKINKQLWERGDGSLFNFLIKQNQDGVTDQLLEQINNNKEVDYDAAAEELYQERRYEDFLNKEVEF